ncbi:MAG: hypothetical protein RBS39_10145 [Phycisphaerales bacterium]|jgi:hypothetical protein|nr:hypothetical protein [Phycisphaerales bacterium]
MRIVLLPVLCILACSPAGFSQEGREPRGRGGRPSVAASDADPAREERERARVEEALAEWKTLANELTQLDREQLPADGWAREWAGDYWDGFDDGGRSALLGPSGRVIVNEWGHFRGQNSIRTGDVVDWIDVDDDGERDTLRIRWDAAAEERTKTPSDQLHLIRWRGPDGEVARRYLVGCDELPDVVDDFNSGHLDRTDLRPSLEMMTPRIRGMPRGPIVVGLPELPEPWRSKLIPPPQSVTVLSVGPKVRTMMGRAVERVEVECTLKPGAAGGAYEGLEFPYTASNGTHGRFRITMVSDMGCKAAYETFQSPREPAPLPAVGEVIEVRENAMP